MKRQHPDRAAARAFYNSLDYGSKWDLMDSMVLGTFDPLDWGLEGRPSREFMRQLERDAIAFEEECV